VTGLERMIRNAVADELRRTPATSSASVTRSAPGLDDANHEILTADQVAALLCVDRKTVYESAARGEIPCARLGRRLVFSRAAVMSCLAACKVRAFGKGK